MSTTALPTALRVGARIAAKDSLRLAAIDVGSNSIHMIVAQADADGGVTTLWRMKEPVGLGRMSFPSKRLSREAMDRAMSALARFQQAATQRQCEKIIAVATSAIREATNGGDFIQRVKRELKLTLRIISAREEARLIYLAVRHALPLGNDPHLIIDIGGGSVEFVVGDERRAMMLESRKLGAARMTAKFVKSDPISASDRKLLSRHYEKELGPLVDEVRTLGPVGVIGTSGTLENIAAMCVPEGGNGDTVVPVIDRRRFERLLALLVKSDTRERSKIRGLDDQRKDQIVAGAMLVGHLFRMLDMKRIQLCPAAMREGILLDYLNRHLPDLDIRREVPDPRRRSVIDLARRCDWHKTHSEQVARLTLMFFDELKSLHGLGPIERELIEYAAMLHDIGWHIAREKHHKHSMYLILHGNLKDFSEGEVNIMANIARYHRKGVPKVSHKAYRMLSARDKRVVDVGAALLRLADGLDRSHSSVVQSLRCKNTDGTIRCRLTTRSDAELEVWGARRKRQWFEHVFKKRIAFDVVEK